MYAVAITLLIYSLDDEKIKQVWYADDASAEENSEDFEAGGSTLQIWVHSVLGYFPNSSKTHLW